MNENWKKVGALLEAMVEAGMYPGIGFDKNGWEAWVFLENPIEGTDDGSVKVVGPTATAAVELLIQRLMALGKDLLKEILERLEELD